MPAITCFPRMIQPRPLQDWFFRSNQTAMGSALCFQLSGYGGNVRPNLDGIQVVNSTTRDAYFQLIYAPDSATAIAQPNGFGQQIPLLFPAKSTLIVKEPELLKNLFYAVGDILFARISETHEIYTPFKRSADGELSGQTSVRG